MIRALLVAVVTVACLAAGCSAATMAARKDPMKCERDPACRGHQQAFDCSTQCSDDPGCLERCNEIQQQTGTSAR